MKTCRKCNTKRDELSFRSNPKVKSGLHSWCRPCEREECRKWRESHREYWKARYHLYDKHGLRPPRKRVYRSSTTPERRRKLRQFTSALRRARILSVICSLTNQEWEKIKESTGYRCVYCGLKLPLTMDHLIPISKGGEHSKSNIVPACKPCNVRKAAGPPPPFIVYPLTTGPLQSRMIFVRPAQELVGAE